MVGVKHTIGTNTGTDALILALKALSIGPGDEVITQVNTFYATVGAIVAVGARPVFVDVDDQYAIDARLIEAAITPRTRAILPVHWAGLPPDMPAIMDLARRRGLYVVEDACPATGAAYAGKAAGSFGDLGAFSMHPLKPLHVWGDGGAVVTNDDRAARWLRLYRNHGMVNRDEIEMWGVNQRLQTLQAVVANRVLDGVGRPPDRDRRPTGPRPRGRVPGPGAPAPAGAPERLPALHRALRAS
jgi:dTDP-3-amino-2,3,6-trideoxy-4-keto-D-glucose/dTDP-3-amino-3,4,6-trideoxy-alpha-D-glucose/dTDP-2,6-dideoxy-D-kanosamine transaminase